MPPRDDFHPIDVTIRGRRLILPQYGWHGHITIVVFITLYFAKDLLAD